MPVRTRKKFSADEVVQAIEAFVTTNRVIGRNDRLRGNDPLVVAAPHLFISDGATSEEIGAARTALHGEPIVPVDDSGPKVLGPIPDARRRIVTENKAVRLPDGSIWSLTAGDIVDANDEGVKALAKLHRGLFAKE